MSGLDRTQAHAGSGGLYSMLKLRIYLVNVADSP